MTRRSGFTLVELVVVIMILGILAGVAAPRFLNTSGAATDNGLRQTLAVIRDAIELYTATPVADGGGGGLLPTAAANLAADIGPFLRGDFPPCPVGANAGSAAVAAIAEADPSAGTEGWRYDSATGHFGVNSGAATASIASTNYDDL
jgi:prepilin-type N-terminal cleavage/methylation domain-containing protein